MKRALLICFFAGCTTLLSAQRIYFVYLQTENNAPFFVRMNDKLYSSSSNGYLILPRLIDSTYRFKLGFPGRNVDLDFSVTVNKKDHGFLVRDFGDKGWGLIDLQTLGIQMSTSALPPGTGDKNATAKVDAFTDMLARATDDPSIKQNPVFASETEKSPAATAAVQKETVKAVEKQDDANRTTEPPANQVVKTDLPGQESIKPVDSGSKNVNPSLNVQSGSMAEKLPATVYKRSKVTKLSGTMTTEGIESVFIDAMPSGNDTVRIFIPAKQVPKPVVKQTPSSAIDTARETASGRKFLDIDDTAKTVKPGVEAKTEEPKKFNLFAKKSNGKTDSSASSSSKKTEAKENRLWPFARQKQDSAAKTCRSATNDDFLKLRRKMAGRTSDDGMLEEARKYFKEKCFTTEQLKNLSSMFLSNAGKFHFFQLGMNDVSDKENFPSLENELKDVYYVNQFRSMLHI